VLRDNAFVNQFPDHPTVQEAYIRTRASHADVFLFVFLPNVDIIPSVFSPQNDETLSRVQEKRETIFDFAVVRRPANCVATAARQLQ